MAPSHIKSDACSVLQKNYPIVNSLPQIDNHYPVYKRNCKDRACDSIVTGQMRYLEQGPPSQMSMRASDQAKAPIQKGALPSKLLPYNSIISLHMLSHNNLLRTAHAHIIVGQGLMETLMLHKHQLE